MALLRYYEGSDFLWSHPLQRVSPVISRSLPTVPSPTTPWAPLLALARYPSPEEVHRLYAGFRLRHFLAGSPTHQAESSSSSYGPAVHLQLLPTPHFCDAVTFGFGTGERMSRRGLSPLWLRAFPGAL